MSDKQELKKYDSKKKSNYFGQGSNEFWPRRVAHVDINAYFATMLQQENPKLRGQPVGVLKDEGRSCVIAASKEAKVLGVKTGMSLVRARRLAPGLITVPANFGMYLDATKKLKQIFTTLAPNTRIFSLDEAFIDLSDCNLLYPDNHQFGQQVQSKIKQELGDWVTCNIGISYTKLLAKLAGESSPKGSITTISPHEAPSWLADASFEDICGVGMRLEKKLSLLGITTPYQINFYTKKQLSVYVGDFWAEALLRIAQGEDSPTLAGLDRVDAQPVKSVSRSITGFKLSDDETQIRQVLYNLTEEIGFKLRKLGMSGRNVGVSLSGHDRRWSKHQTIKQHLNQTKDIFEWIYYRFYKNWQRDFPIIKFKVFVGSLTPLEQTPQSILLADRQWQSVGTAMDSINDRYGLFTLRSGVLTTAPIIRPEVTGFLGDKKFHGL